MKKLFAMLMAVTMLGSLAACGQSAPANQSSASSSSSHTATEAKTEASKLSASTVQFKDTQWNSTVMYVYYWSSDNSKMVDWPGKQMKAVTGETSTYTYDLPDGVEFVIFTNGSTNQTRDIKLDGKNQQFRNTSETDVDGSNYVETMDGKSVDTMEIGGSSGQIVDVDKLKEIENSDTFGVKVTKKELEKNYFDTDGKYGKDALTFEFKNDSGKTVNDVEIFAVAYDSNNNILPIKTDDFKPYNINYLIYTFSSNVELSIEDGKSEKLALSITAGDIAGVRCIVKSCTADGKKVENDNANEWVKRAIKGEVIDFD